MPTKFQYLTYLLYRVSRNDWNNLGYESEHQNKKKNTLDIWPAKSCFLSSHHFVFFTK